MTNDITIKADILLFDLDGTLVNSTLAVEKTWEDQINIHNKAFPDKFIDLTTFLHGSHGVRTSETFARSFPELKNDKETIDAWELQIVKKYGYLGKQIEGAISTMDNITKQNIPWAIVTSGTTDLAHSWFTTIFKSVQKPKVFITAHDVSQGKPNPEGYCSAFESLKKIYKLGDSAKGVVFEDAPNGVRAGVNGGFTVVGIASSFSKEVLVGVGATYVVEDFTKVKINKVGDKVELELEVL
ncbi:DOG1 2-deoxyglucose-6-phosphate phosphatase 1 [Candida maltosa Xu316]|uniref:2-deoxyglucose-6-phosphate phosphatase n=1 Tax=Candida maltosa (strain Xu316) TaxID=1245528 RepID=M3JDL1_CANMX|nr:hypothetical protein G210_4682 [Candida maltosa Xu316]